MSTSDNLVKQNNRKARVRFITESILLMFIVLSPFIFKLHEYVSTDPEATINFLGIEITNNGFRNVNVYVWFLLGKFVPLYLLIIWFLTCKHWWYHLLLIPVCMYAFQIFEVVYSEDDFVDTENIMWILPVCMVVIPFVYFIRLKLYDKYVHGIDLELLNAELQWYKEKEANQKFGIKPLEKPEPPAEPDLSSETPKRILSGFFKNLF